MIHLKKLLLLFLFSLILASCYNVQRNCTDFKTGTFEYTYTIDGVEQTSTFFRNDTLEVDYYENVPDSSSIRWINDCEFIVEKINPTSLNESKAVHMKILTTKDNSYTYEYSLVGDASNKQKGTVTKIK
ncbi:hypothetical protein [Galbibacter sp.]|jgi:hypothetical protein|uniref:hypothetical protein n=1 Tax=Galbibacter sp. TaxID=2918471 RepID=UPI003A95DA81